MSSKLVNTKLSPNPTRVLLNQHLTDLLVIDGNSTADPDKLRQFYMILMDGLHPTHLLPFLSTQGPHTQCCCLTSSEPSLCLIDRQGQPVTNGV